MEVLDVQNFIDENILHSRVFDDASEKDKKKAVNNSVNVLYEHLGIYESKKDIPVEDVVEQVLFLFKMDDTFQRAEMGVMGITVDGVYIQFSDMDRTVSPKILSKKGISNAKKRRVGAYTYSVHDSNRMGISAIRSK